jgi:hypothetical protein
VENLVVELPVWSIFLCLLGGVAYAGILYWKNSKLAGKNRWLVPSLGLLRFLTISLVGFLLLSPMLRFITEDSKLPVIVILRDVSESVGQWVNQSESGLQITDEIRSFEAGLDGQARVEQYTIGASVRPVKQDSIEFTDPISNLDQSIQYVSDVYDGENLGAIVIVSDGIFNEGRNPIYANYAFTAPIYSVALGDTLQQKDLSLKSVLYNEIAYLEDQLLIEADIQAFNASGEFTTFIVQKRTINGFTEIERRTISIDDEDFFRTEAISLTMDQAGINHFRLRVTPGNGESNISNNVKDIFIEVIDGRQVIRILAESPHPDIAALKQLFEERKNYEIDVYFAEDEAIDLTNSNLVIFHNLPSVTHRVNAQLEFLNRENIPRLFIVGSQVDLVQFNKIQRGVTIESQARSINQAQPALVTDFNLFTTDEFTDRFLSIMPPLSSPFGEYLLSGNVKVLLNQEIGGISTDFPLLAFVDQEGTKTTYLFGEGIWRWKLFDFLENGNFNTVSDLVSKTVVYTTSKDDKRRFRILQAENIYEEYEDVSFRAELYNSSYELVNDPDVSLSIEDENGNAFSFLFTKDSQGYELNAGKFAPGEYKFQASTNLGGEEFRGQGKFTIKEAQFELYNLTAQHNVLVSLGEEYGGEVVYPGDINRISTDLIEKELLKPVIYQNARVRGLIDLKVYFALIVLLLGLEWFVRRYFGSII